MVLNENELKKIIETYVICYLTETGMGGGGSRSALTDKKRVSDSEIIDKEGESEKNKELRNSLRTPGLNMSIVARELLRNTWSGMKLDTARSKLSKISRGVLSPTPEEYNYISRSINRIAGKIK